VLRQDGEQAGDSEGVPQGGAEVAPRQLPGGREEGRREEVHRHRCRQGGTLYIDVAPSKPLCLVFV
jgi:hypothetical protein